MAYFKPDIGAVPFSSNELPIFIEHPDCTFVKRELKKLGIDAAVRRIDGGECKIMTRRYCEECDSLKRSLSRHSLK